MSRHDPGESVRDMLDHAREAVEMTRGRGRSDLDANRMLALALTRLMEIIGEACVRVPDEFRTLHPGVPWRDISDLRNRLVHGYDAINHDILWKVISDDLPPLIDRLEMIVRND